MLVEFRVALEEMVARAVVGGRHFPLPAFFEEVLLNHDAAFSDLFSFDVQRFLEPAVNRRVNHRVIAALLHAANFHPLDGDERFQPLQAQRQLLAGDLPLKLGREKIIERGILLRLEQGEEAGDGGADRAGSMGAKAWLSA